jgi:acetylglutamate synthase
LSVSFSGQFSAANLIGIAPIIIVSPSRTCVTIPVKLLDFDSGKVFEVLFAKGVKSYKYKKYYEFNSNN